LGWIIDILNTKNDYPWYYMDKEKCKECSNVESCTENKWENTKDIAVLGHHTIIDNNEKEMRILYRYMTDPWVVVSSLSLF